MLQFFKQLHKEHGQSLTELALFLPILLLMLIGFIEIGTLINDYINAVDSSRGAARYAAPLDPAPTQCSWFGSGGNRIDFADIHYCPASDYVGAAQTVKSWGADTVYDTCQVYTGTNFFYVAGCMAVLNLPKGGLDPISRTIWTEGDYLGDDIVVTTVPISNGVPLLNGARTWSLYGNQPSAAFPSFVISITNPATNEFGYQQSFKDALLKYASAPPTGVVVVEVYRAHPQLIKLFTTVNLLAGSSAILPDPIPVHAYSIFPLVALDPSRME